MTKRPAILSFTISLLFLFGSLFFLFPAIQSFLLYIGGRILGRPLNNPDFWKCYMRMFGFLFLFASVSCVWLYARTTDKYKDFYLSNREKYDHIICIAISVIILILFMLPFIIFGENSVITIHDNLDDSIPRFHYIYKHNLFWKFDTKLPVLNGISTLFFNREGFSLLNAIYCLLPTYLGYIINHFVCVLLGFFSMYYLQKQIFKNENLIIITLTSLAYGLLPVVCVYKMSAASLPLVIIIFYKLLTTNNKKWYLFSFLYPFISELASVGLFVCGFWLIAFIALSIKQKRVLWRMLVGLVLIIFGFGITNMRLIYMRLLVHEALNRDYSWDAPNPFVKTFLAYLFNGYYHSATLQNRIIDWIVLFVSGGIIIRCLKNKKVENNKLHKFLFFSVIISIFCSFIAALSDAGLVNKILKVVFPPLAGVSFSRVFTLSKIACYIAFTASLLILEKNTKTNGFAYILGLLQIAIIFFANPQIQSHYYADSEPSWRKNLIGSGDITWKEFYSEEQFKEIKNSINYKGEGVCAVGYHPGVLLYNDFNTIDGYLSVYPYEQQVLWHNLMMPEFKRNKEDMEYFDSWGGRRYVYNKDLRYHPTREKYHEPIDLFIDMNIFKNDFSCKYIFSRAEISNAAELGLSYKGSFDSPESIYIIYVYEVD